MLEDAAAMQLLEVAGHPWGGYTMVLEVVEQSWMGRSHQRPRRETSWCWRGGDPILEGDAAGFTIDDGVELGTIGDGVAAAPCG